MAKISKLPLLISPAVDDLIPVVHNDDNYAVLAATLKGFFQDSTLVIFDEIDDATPTLIEGDSGYEEGYTYAVVYLTKKKTFAMRRSKEGVNTTYFSDFSRKSDFITYGVVRSDRVFFNIEDKELYVFNGSLHNLFDTVRINAMTEEEFENLENPIEGAFYATYEE